MCPGNVSTREGVQLSVRYARDQKADPGCGDKLRVDIQGCCLLKTVTQDDNTDVAAQVAESAAKS